VSTATAKTLYSIWLFGGVYRVKERLNKPEDYGYVVELTDQFSEFIGRLKMKWPRQGRAKSRVFENCIAEFI
jgi:hypothetical protein